MFPNLAEGNYAKSFTEPFGIVPNSPCNRLTIGIIGVARLAADWLLHGFPEVVAGGIAFTNLYCILTSQKKEDSYNKIYDIVILAPNSRPSSPDGSDDSIPRTPKSLSSTPTNKLCGDLESQTLLLPDLTKYKWNPLNESLVIHLRNTITNRTQLVINKVAYNVTKLEEIHYSESQDNYGACLEDNRLQIRHKESIVIYSLNT